MFIRLNKKVRNSLKNNNKLDQLRYKRLVPWSFSRAMFVILPISVESKEQT